MNENESTYDLKAALEAIGLPESMWYFWKKMRKITESYGPLKEPLLFAMAREHPRYGYRRVRPKLNARGPRGRVEV